MDRAARPWPALRGPRVAYQNKFGHPDYYFSRIHDHRDMALLWWIDPAKERDYERALADPSVKLEVGPLEVKYWQEYAKRNPPASAKPASSAAN